MSLLNRNSFIQYCGRKVKLQEKSRSNNNRNLRWHSQRLTNSCFGELPVFSQNEQVNQFTNKYDLFLTTFKYLKHCSNEFSYKTLNINQICKPKTYRLKIEYLFQRQRPKAPQLNKIKLGFFSSLDL